MGRATIFRIVFWVALALALAAALNPHPPHIPGEPSDKVEHILAFLTLTGLSLAAYPGARLLPLALALSGFGALIEFLQMIPALHRSSELLDWVADTGAVLAVLAIVWVFGRFRSGDLAADGK
jgi:VanZ family protein